MPCSDPKYVSMIEDVGLLNVHNYNLPDVVSLFETQSCTLDNTSLIYVSRVNKNMNVRRSIMNRVKQYNPEVDHMSGKL